MTLSTLTIQSGRLIKTIHETAAFGPKGVWGPEPTQVGMCRLALSDEDKLVRDWLKKEALKLGCKVTVDAMGNIFCEYPGKRKGKPTAMGSHLDTQPTGGRYDGILGVLSGLEVLRTIHENKYVPEYPIVLIDWTNEEGARFPMSIMSSSVWAENIDIEKVYSMKAIDSNGNQTSTSVKDELARIGYLGDTPASYKSNAIEAYFELHIEQGPILEHQDKLIGIVTNVQAYSWVTTKVFGKAQHTGTTPLKSRSDAMLLAARLIVKGNEVARANAGLFSVGVLTLKPAAVNVIPEYVEFVFDIRHTSDERLAKMHMEIETEFAAIVDDKTNGLYTSLEFDLIYTSPAVQFDKGNIECVRSAAFDVVGEENALQMISGAGHDACAVNDRVPTSMIFIPSKEGVSHNPSEYSKPEEVELGFRVLLETVLAYDKGRV